MFDSPSQTPDEQLADGSVAVVCVGLNGLQELKVEEEEEAVRSPTGEKL